MTSAEFKIAFETRFYAATTVNGLGWSNDEISEFLNYGQNTLVSAIAESGNLEAISNLVKLVNLAAPLETNGEFRFNPAINDLYVLIDAELVVSGNNYPMEKIGVEAISAFKVTPYNTAIFRQPKIAIDNSLGLDTPTFVVLKGTYIVGTPSALNYRYVVKPTAIDIDTPTETNLNIVLHDKVVDIAVQKAVETYIKTGQSTQ